MDMEKALILIVGNVATFSMKGTDFVQSVVPNQKNKKI